MKTYFKNAFWSNFLGQSPDWFKLVLLLFLVSNPIMFFINPFIAGWYLVAEFIFILAMALRCYPLLPGGLIAIEALLIGMTTPDHVFNELIVNFQLFLLLIFMVSGIYFIRQLLLIIFTRLILNIRNKVTLSLAFCLTTACLSAFLDALTVMAVVISVATSFYEIYQQTTSNQIDNSNYIECNNFINLNTSNVLNKLHKFLRSLLMHASVGTALGGVMTMIGEPQNLIIAQAADWQFSDFFLHVAPVSIPVFIFGLLTCWFLEKFNWFGYGEQLPTQVYNILQKFNDKISHNRTRQDNMRLFVQGIIGILMILALVFHITEAGLIGLSMIIITTAFTGVTNEHLIREAFTETVPFTALLTTFFVVISVIVDQQLFTPIIRFLLSQKSQELQLSLFYLFNGLLSSISDNIFVGMTYINELKSALKNNFINKQQFDLLAIAINTGTNLPSVATPNGQAAFLFLLTSKLASLIQLSYGRMIWMALPYTLVLTIVGLLCVTIMLIPITQYLIQLHFITGY